MKIIGVIPARWASTRFAGKVLADLKGSPMLQHVWQRAKQSRTLDEVFIACDDDRVFDAAQGFGAKTVMTSVEHTSGTERIAKAFRLSDADIIVNIQGDEPLIEPALIDAVAKALADDTDSVMATAVKRIDREEDLNNPNVVKVAVGGNNNALYFSRAAIPFYRDPGEFGARKYFKHIGIYAYRRSFLAKFKELPVSELEQSEKLEQLRVLDAGYKITTVETAYDTIGVDTPEDLKRVEELIGQGEQI